MNSALLFTLTGTGFAIAFLHAAIPTHWLPFVVVGRARGWAERQTILAVALAGGGHVLTTTALGISLAWFGFEIDDRIDHVLHRLVAALLIGLGGWLALRAPHGQACAHCQGQPKQYIPVRSDRAVLWGLFLTLTLSPCELFLPVYLTAAPYGWSGIVLLSAVLAVGTLGGMLVFTWITLRGMSRVPWLATSGNRLLGSLLCALGVVVVFMES